MPLFGKLSYPKSLIAVAPPPPWANLYAEATRAYEAKDLEAAIALYDQVIALLPDHAEAWYKRGNALKDLGQAAAALKSYDEAIQRKPEHAHAWCNRGVVQHSLSLHEAALASYDRAIALDPTDAIVHSNRGALMQTLAAWESALVSYDRVIALNPSSFQTWFHRGNVLRETQQLGSALANYDEAVRLNPDFAEAYYNRGVVLEQVQRPQEALNSYDQAVALDPSLYKAHFNRAGVLTQLRKLEAASAAYDDAIAIKTDYMEAYTNRGVVLSDLGNFEAALATYDRALSIRPDYAEAHFNRGTVLKVQKRWDEALASFDRSIAFKPEQARAYCERAATLMELKRLDEALSSYNRAVAIQPELAEAQYNRALALLLKGDYGEGWLNYEWRWKNSDRLGIGAKRVFKQPLWLGDEPIRGKRLLIYSEQGLGDTLQFCRFAKLAADLGAIVILEVQAALAKLIATLEGPSQVIVLGSPLPDFDYRCPILSLPLALRTTIDTVPASTRYLHSDEAKVRGWLTRLGNRSRPRIGLTWSGNPTQRNDCNRSFRLVDWINYLPRQFEYICLQQEIRPADDATLKANPWIRRLITERHDFSDTAALCCCMDLNISVCTSVAHLSGALGRPTWVLLPFNPDWRWLLEREDSPWYPTAKLYRQQAIGDWSEVLARVATDVYKEFGADIVASHK